VGSTSSSSEKVRSIGDPVRLEVAVAVDEIFRGLVLCCRRAGEELKKAEMVGCVDDMQNSNFDVSLRENLVLYSRKKRCISRNAGLLLHVISQEKSCSR
jgi:hypothetical protein